MAKEWEESKHPRDDDGKFTDGAGVSKLEMANEIYSDTPEEDSKTLNRVDKVNPPKAYSFNRLNTKHHKDHAKAMGFKNTKEYEAAAVEFFNSDRGILYYSEARKRYYRYEEKTGLFCVGMDGVVNTFNTYSKKKFDLIKRQDKLHE